jgi:hypothetical protein
MGKKNKKPLTTSFIRELAKKSQFEDLEFKIRNAGSEAHWNRIRNMNSDALLEEGRNYGAELLGEAVFNINDIGGVRYTTTFSAWFSSYIRAINNIPELREETITYACSVPVAGLIEKLDANMKFTTGKGLTGENKEEIAKNFLKVLGLRAYTHRIHHRWMDTHRATYMYSPALAEMLCHTRLDTLPVSALRLPYPFIELSFPDGLFPNCPLTDAGDPNTVVYVKVKGATVEEQTDVGSWRMSVWGLNPEGEINLLHQYSLKIKTDKSVAVELDNAFSQLDEMCASYTTKETVKTVHEYSKGINTFIVASVVYATMPNADAILGADSPEYATWAKEMAAKKLNRHQQKDVNTLRGTVERPNRYLLGRSIRIIDRHEIKGDSVSGEKRMSPRMHWRAGHFHLYWTGPKDGSPRDSVVKFVEPTIVNAPEGTTELDVSKAGMR